MCVTLPITPATAARCGKKNDFTSKKICYWILPRLIVRDVDSLISLVEEGAINLGLTSYRSEELRLEAFIKLGKLGDASKVALFFGGGKFDF